jgi:hypothetical protein
MENFGIVGKLSKIQADLKVNKDKKNTFGNYMYRSAESILEGIKPFIKDLDAVVILSDEIVQVANRVYVKATATISFQEGSLSVSAFARESEEKKGMDSAQVTGAASSYARKYAMQGLFAIDDGEDADSQDNTQKGAAAPKKISPANSGAPKATLRDKAGALYNKIREGKYTEEQAQQMWDGFKFDHKDTSIEPKMEKSFSDLIKSKREAA